MRLFFFFPHHLVPSSKLGFGVGTPKDVCVNKKKIPLKGLNLGEEDVVVYVNHVTEIESSC